MDPSTDDATEKLIDEQLSRVERIKQAHPYARDVQIRGLLIVAYDGAVKDPSTGGPEGVQILMESYVDILLRMTEHDFKDELAMAAEYWQYTWDELEEKFMEVLDDT